MFHPMVIIVSATVSCLIRLQTSMRVIRQLHCVFWSVDGVSSCFFFVVFLVCCALKCFLFEADMLVLMNLQLLSRKYNSHGAHFHVTQLCIYIWMCVFPLQYNGFKHLRSEIPCIFLTSWIYPMSMLCLFFESQLWLNRVDLKWLLKCH